jgi:hypothetical protein
MAVPVGQVGVEALIAQRGFEAAREGAALAGQRINGSNALACPIGDDDETGLLGRF